MTDMTPEDLELLKARVEEQKQAKAAADGVSVFMPDFPAGFKNLSPREQELAAAAMLRRTQVVSNRANAKKAAALEQKRLNLISNRKWLADQDAAEISAHSVMPEIPSVETVAAYGLKPGNYQHFLRTAGLVALDLPFEVDVQNMDVLERAALEILPAFLIEFGDRYPYNPRTLVNAWVRAMTPDESKSGFTAVGISELREVVLVMAKNREPFNPRTMMKYAVQMRLDVMTGLRKAPELNNPGRELKFVRTLADEGKFEPTNWVENAGYPNAFPESAIDDTTLEFINKVVHYRWFMEHKDGLVAPSANALAENLLRIAIYTINEGKQVNFQTLFELAYRYPVEYLGAIRPSNVSREESERHPLAYDPMEDFEPTEQP